MGAKFYGNAVGQNGWSPTWSYIDASTESLSTVTNPGYINSILAAGNNIDTKSLVVVAYDAGTQIFQQTNVDGVITLSIYSPGDNSFPFTNVQFVAKGGSDLNAGNMLGSPKLTIPAALSALSGQGVVWVLDSGTYSEPFVIPPNVGVYAPTAVGSYTNATGSYITLNDTGVGYLSFVNFAALQVGGGAQAITVNGTQSALIAQFDIWTSGPAAINGIMSIFAQIISNSIITVGASGQLYADVSFSGISTIVQTTPGTASGKFGNDFFADQTFKNRSISYQDELQETVGRQLQLSDGGSDVTIQFNSMSPANYILPQTSDVDIPVGTVITWAQVGAGAVNFLQGTGVTILSLAGTTPQTIGTGSKAFAEKLSDTVWLVSGDIQAVGP
jgi:hypothetical protein